MSDGAALFLAFPIEPSGRCLRRLAPARRLSLILHFAVLLVGAATPRWALASPCATPARLGDGWETSRPVDARIDADALCKILKAVAGGSDNLHSLLVARDGRIVAELYRKGRDRSARDFFSREVSFGPADRHDMRSISKSIVALLYGIVREEGTLPPLPTPVVDLYPAYPALASDPARKSITVEHTLTMANGLEWHETAATYGSFSNDETRLFWDWSPVKFVLGRPISSPAGQTFNYNGGNTVIIADLLERATKMPLDQLARLRLLQPLGITDYEWLADLWGRPMAYAGLRLKPRDLLKIGRMMLDHGRWQSRQIVPAAWVVDSIRPHIATGRGPGSGYGYFWWTGTVDWQDKKLSWGAAIGNGGQRLFLVPALHLEVVMTAGAYNDAGIAVKEADIFNRVVAAVQP
jgi:CubicO group peptidase (beta-lactamase class C family)